MKAAPIAILQRGFLVKKMKRDVLHLAARCLISSSAIENFYDNIAFSGPALLFHEVIIRVFLVAIVSELRPSIGD